MPRGTFLVVTYYRNRCLITAKFSLFSLRAILTNYLTVRYIIYHHSATHKLFYYILLSTSYINPALSTSKSCGWSLEYQFLSVQHEPWTSFPQEPASRSTPAYLTSTARHTRDTTAPHRQHSNTRTNHISVLRLTVYICPILTKRATCRQKFSKNQEEFHEIPSDEVATFVQNRTDMTWPTSAIRFELVLQPVCTKLHSLKCAIGNARFIGLTLRVLGQ